DDLAAALLCMLENYDDEAPLNMGSSSEITIAALAQKIAMIVGYKGEIIFDTTHPDGVARKLLDSSRLHALGWRAQIDLDTGLAHACRDYCERHSHAA